MEDLLNNTTMSDIHFSSPSNGSDDLYGTVSKTVIKVYSRFNNNKLVWTKRIGKTEKVVVLSDPEYTNDAGNHNIAVVCQLRGERSFIVVSGSTIENFSQSCYNNDIQKDIPKVEGWSAKVGNSNVTYVFATILGQKWFDFENNGSVENSQLPDTYRMFFCHKFLIRNVFLS